MNEITILATALGILGTISAFVFGFSLYKRNKKIDDEREGKESGTVLTEIGYIKSGVDDIKRKQEKQDDLYVGLITKITTVEASTKQAHKRLDRLEGISDH